MPTICADAYDIGLNGSLPSHPSAPAANSANSSWIASVFWCTSMACPSSGASCIAIWIGPLAQVQELRHAGGLEALALGGRVIDDVGNVAPVDARRELRG